MSKKSRKTMFHEYIAREVVAAIENIIVSDCTSGSFDDSCLRRRSKQISRYIADRIVYRKYTFQELKDITGWDKKQEPTR